MTTIEVTYKAISTGGGGGGSSGGGDTTFEPDTPMSRAMLVTVLWRMDGDPIVNSANIFTDVADDA